MSSSRRLSWIDEARKRLFRLALPGSGWGYRPDGMPAAEPTALACLALLATHPHDGTDSVAAVLPAAVQWLSSIQQQNGAVGVSETLPTPEWPTAYAILLWASQKCYSAQAEQATSWLLRRTGIILGQGPAGMFGHNTTIVGWPWVAGTHSWIEPTAMAVLALRRRGMWNHARTREGLHLIADRAIATGGWNYGNNAVYGTNLRPQPAPTGIALMALSGTRAMDDIIFKACAYLKDVLPSLRSAQSLCWGILGLAAWGLKPPNAEHWLQEAFDLTIRHKEQAPQLAYLLLAASERSLLLLGAQSNK